MDAVRRLPDVRGDLAVGERQGGKRQADAFRRALGQSADGEPAPGGDRPADRSPPTPSRLQRQAAPGRREDVGVAHVDVYA
jgi:hypothetical protein